MCAFHRGGGCVFVCVCGRTWVHAAYSMWYVFSVYTYACRRKQRRRQELKVWWSTSAAAAAACQSYARFVSGPWCIVSEVCGLWQFRRRMVNDALFWQILEGRTQAAGLLLTSASVWPPSIWIASLLPVYVVACNVGFKCLEERADGSRTILRDMLYPWRHLHYRYDYVKEEQFCSCWTKQAFKWETILVITVVPGTARHILMRIKHFFDHYLRGKKTQSTF